MTTNRQLRDQALAHAKQTCRADLSTIALDFDATENQRRDQAIHVLCAYLEATDQEHIAHAFRRALVGEFV
ncbi:gp41 [Burkholderia phage BcepB1A]|uniref:gp41 n=1 Tax=Burkholderia phage BcepB1A TaxID=279530 RepID=UPI00003779A1|nr:gp41 [Burkholderia phage BcepB1A]AAT37742.1 gp41 [Burkholderia phage BcepB1A]